VTKTRYQTKPKFDDQELYELAESFGTPYFLIDEEVLRKNVSEVEEAYQGFRGPFRVAYSIKANFNPAVIRTFVSEGIMFDLTATNELYFLLKCGGSPENVIYTSITETASEYESMLSRGVRKIVVSSYNGLLNLIDANTKAGGTTKVLIRVNPEVRVKAELRFSLRHGKFGVPLDAMGEDSAMFMLKKVFETSSLEFDGFHFHLGSQIEDPSCYSEALEKLESFILDARRTLGDFPINTLDIGGGLPSWYGKSVPAPADFSARIMEQLSSLAESFGGKFTLIVESGRFLSADSTVMVSRIVNVKRFNENKYVYVDAGYHDLADSALLRHEYPVEVIPGGSTAQQKTVLVGRLCDSLDVFTTSSRSKLGGAEVNKLVVFRGAGAYSIVLASPFHCQPKPYVLMRDAQGKYQVVRKGQTVEELFESEGGVISGSSSSA